MMIRLSNRFIHFVLAAWFLLPGLLAGQSQSEFSSLSIQDILGFLEKSRQNITTLTQTRKLLAMNYDSLVFDIDLLKQSNDLGFFDRMRLKNMLKESEDIAQQFVKIDNMLKAHEQANHQKTVDMVQRMEREIQDSIRILYSRLMPGSDSYRERLLKLGRMLSEWNSYHIFRMKKFSLPVTEIRIVKDDAPEALFQKSDYLLDQADRLSQYVEELDRVIGSLSVQNNMKRLCLDLVDRVKNDPSLRAQFQSYFPDSILAFQRLPLSKSLVSPFDGYETLVERLTFEREAALSRIKIYADNAADIREMAEYKSRMWSK